MELLCSEIQSTYKCKFNVDIKNIEKEYIGEDALQLSKYYYHSATFKNGNEFKFEILFNDLDESSIKDLTIVMAKDSTYQITNLTVTYDLAINGSERNGCKNGKNLGFINPQHTKCGVEITLSWLRDKISTCKGTIEIEFEPSSSVAKKEELKCLIFQEAFGSKDKDLDFTIICQGESFKFNKHILCSISDVFQKMIETPNTKEAKSGSVHVREFSADTVKTFKNVMFGNNVCLDENELTVDLLLFANKYCILALVKVVTNHLCQNLTFENIFSVIQAAYLIDNEDLLKASAKFINGNSGHFKTDEKWNKFKDQHPKCAVKLLDFMMYTKLN